MVKFCGCNLLASERSCTSTLNSPAHRLKMVSVVSVVSTVICPGKVVPLQTIRNGPTLELANTCTMANPLQESWHIVLPEVVIWTLSIVADAISTWKLRKSSNIILLIWCIKALLILMELGKNPIVQICPFYPLVTNLYLYLLQTKVIHIRLLFDISVCDFNPLLFLKFAPLVSRHKSELIKYENRNG